jgi:hypothetical protein
LLPQQSWNKAAAAAAAGGQGLVSAVQGGIDPIPWDPLDDFTDLADNSFPSLFSDDLDTAPAGNSSEFCSFCQSGINGSGICSCDCQGIISSDDFMALDSIFEDGAAPADYGTAAVDAADAAAGTVPLVDAAAAAIAVVDGAAAVVAADAVGAGVAANAVGEQRNGVKRRRRPRGTTPRYLQMKARQLEEEEAIELTAKVRSTLNRINRPYLSTLELSSCTSALKGGEVEPTQRM